MTSIDTKFPRLVHKLKSISRKYQHSKYLKIINKVKHLAVHDPNNICKKGDLVQIIETRPISRKKNWIIQKIILKK